MSRPSSQNSHLRLDDLFRTVVHLRPKTAFAVIAPDLLQGVRSAVAFTRLDTQLAPSRRLPDVAYLVEGSEELAVVIVEGQAQASKQSNSRATSIATAYMQSAPAGDSVFELRLIELRTGARSRLAGKPHPGPIGRLRFEPSNALLDLDPDDTRVRAPETWPLLALSRNVTAAHLDQLMVRLAAMVQPEHPRANTVTPTDVHLLGAISRARFPEYPWSHQAQESYVNDTQNIETAASGHLTPDEVLQLEIQAANERRRVLAEMEAAARREGAALAERALLMKLAEKLAPERLVEFEELESVDELERVVLDLVSKRR